MGQLTLTDFESGLDHIRQSPRDEGRVELIVRRPAEDEREILDEGILDVAEGLVGDNWRARGSRKMPDGSAHPDMQINIMNSRVSALVAGDPGRRHLAGDQFHVDLDLSPANLPPGTRLAIGTAVLEVTAIPHTGCWKFAERYGPDAIRFVNSEVGRALNLRGVNARILVGGGVRTGDTIRKLAP